jgi:hypothetical protein|tara:strand:+ start:13556 stop:13924 length:369 start_codon:yes stop_codon:yes gene_type:complete
MNTYSIYNTTSGVIESQVGGTSMTIDDVVLTDDQSVIAGQHDPLTQKIVDGEAVTYEADITGWLRRNRDLLLSSCDWTQGSDSPLSSSKKTEWATYRQALRDLPATNTATTEDAVVWPTTPA